MTMRTQSTLNRIVMGIGAAAIALSSAAACVSTDERDPFDTEPGNPKGEGVGGKAEEWGYQDSPFIFDPNVKTKYSELPKQGETENAPWASSYWPYYQDSLNYRWAGESTMSPAEKFQEATGIAGVTDGVSKEHGVDSQDHRTACTKDDDCDSAKVEKCAKRIGETGGYCIPTWFGICPAWAAAALLLEEPKREVDYNGVNFKINDIKALVTLSHERVGSKFVSLRCNTNPDDIEYDDDGRPTSASCRYTNPATYHILLANYLGLRKQGFIEDRTFSAEVWNQPIRGFKVDDEREVSITEANQLIGVQPENLVKVEESAAVTKAKWVHFGPYSVNADDSINVRMTGNGDADLHVRLGAKPNDNDYDCRPYSDNSVESCNIQASAGTTEFYVSVKGYADTSDFDLVIEHGGVPSTYKFNSKAKSFRYVKTTVSWIGESPSETDGNLGSTIDRYTKTDTYEYILELDADGKLIGGEWVGNSKSTHPDFLWLPTGLSESSRTANGKIKWGDVKKIYELSIDEPQTATEYTWNGNASIISMTSETDTGYGLDMDMSRIHPGNAKPVVFFQWEIDGRDGRRLEIKGGSKATITYGSWGDRTNDRTYKNVTLPFVLDPAKDGKNVSDGQYYVVAVKYEDEPGAKTDVVATTTDAAASSATSEKAEPVSVDGHTWNGNASVISHSSGSKTGYGLNFDIANIHPTSASNPVVFFQWEVSAADGNTLEISADGMTKATITYGTWSNRDADVTKTVNLPYTIDPAADGLTVQDGSWFVIKVAFDSKPATKTAVWAKTPNARP